MVLSLSKALYLQLKGLFYFRAAASQNTAYAPGRPGYKKAVLFCLWLLVLTNPAKSQGLDTTLVKYYFSPTVMMTARCVSPTWTAGQDSFLLCNFMDAGGKVALQDLEYIRDVAYKNVQLNPKMNILSEQDNPDINDEILFYFNCNETPSNYDMKLIFNKLDYDRKPVTQLTLFYLNNTVWEQVITPVQSGDSISIVRSEGEQCNIGYILQADTEVTVRIFDKYGEEVFAGTYKKGEEGGIGSSTGSYLNQVVWDGRNKKKRLVDNGGYLCRIYVKGQGFYPWKIGVWR
jgi:hypothetical protein